MEQCAPHWLVIACTKLRNATTSFVKEETSVHILCECEALASLRYIYLGSFFLDPDDIKKLGVGAIWRFGNARRLL